MSRPFLLSFVVSRFTVLRFPPRLRPILQALAITLIASAGAPTASASVALVQHASKDAGVTSSSSLAFSASNTAGDWLAVVIRGGHTNQIFSVSDSRGNTYHQAVQFNQTLDAPNGETLAIFYAENIAAGTNTVNVSESIANNSLRFAILEYSGLAPSNSLDATAAAQGSGTALNSGNALTTSGGDLILGEVTSADGVTFTAGAGYTIEERVPAAPNTKLLVEDTVQAAAGAISVGATLSTSDNGAALLAAFKAVASGVIPPSISSLNPGSGPVGTQVTIAGTGFGASQGNSTVTFNGVTATPSSWTATSIVAPVPAAAATGNVVVTVAGLPSNSVLFTVPVPPVLTSLSPTSGSAGTSVTITGANFGASQGTSTVTLNGTAATPANWSATSIAVTIPNGASSGNVIVTVGGLPSNGLGFTVTPSLQPLISSLSPPLGVVGTSVSINGANFSASQGTSTVTFNGTPATPANWSASSIVVPVPAGATTGNVVVTVGGVTSNASNFAVTVPATAVTLVQHASKDAGTATSASLAFKSNNSPGNWIAVAVRAGRSGQVFTVSDSLHNSYKAAAQLNVTVDTPNGDTLAIFYAENIAAGANTVTVSDNLSASLRFAIFEYSGVALANSLDTAAANQGTSASPNSGNATTTANGDLLLGALMSANTATYTAGSGYKIEEFVPAEPNSKLAAEDRIQSALGSASASATLASSDNWGAIVAAFKSASGAAPASPTITGLNPAFGQIGTAVTMNGTNFGASQGSSTIAFNGAAATPSNWTATSISAVVPAGATTGNVVVTVGGVASNAVTFTVAPPTPSVASLNPASAIVGSGPLTLTVTGTNFVPSSTLLWNGGARTTSVMSGTQLQAQITAADIAVAGGARISVSNPGIGGSVSNAATFLVGFSGGSNFAVIAVNQPAQDLVYDPRNAVFYLSVTGTASSNPNTISVLNPGTATISATQSTGLDPNVLAISDDSQFLYAGIDGTASVQRFILPALAPDINYALGSNTFGPYFALDLQVAPGAPHTTAVTLGSAGISPAADGGITIFDDTVARPAIAKGFGPGGGSALYGSLQWGADSGTLFASNTEDGGFDFYTLAVNSSGVTLTQDFPSAFTRFADTIHFDPGTELVYSEDGRVINPSTGFPVGNFNTAGSLAVDAGLNTAFFLRSGSGAAIIQSFDLTHFTPIGSIAIPGAPGTLSHLIRWGQNGLAFISNSPGLAQVYLVGGSFVGPAPAFATTPPPTPADPPTPAPNAPVITSLAPSSAIAGSPSLLLNVNGTQFDPAATVLFNGSSLATTYVSSTQLQAAIPAADLAAPGTANVIVANPAASGGNSSSSTFFIGASGGVSSSGGASGGGSSGGGFAFQILNQASEDIAFDPADGLIYLSAPNTNSIGNTISVLDPVTLQIVGEQYAGSNPRVISISDDGHFLYAGIDGSSSIQRFILPGLSPDISYSLGTGGLTVGPYFALDLQAAPGTPHTTAVSLGASGSDTAALGGVEIFDDAVARPTIAPGFGPGGGALYDSLQWGFDATTLFAANNEDGYFDFYSLAVTPTGVTLANDYPNTFSSFTNSIHFDRGTKLLYADDGHVVDPATGLTVGNFGVSGPMTPDSTLNLAFFVTLINGGVAIQSFDLTHFTPVSSIGVPGVNGTPKRLIRWGQNGLAFNTDAGQIVLVGGAFIH